MLRRYEQFASAISRIYHQIQRCERDEMAVYGLKGPHAQFLIAMCRFRDGITVSQLCKVCEKDKGAVSRAVSELEGEGLVVRDCSRGNTYRAPIALTEKGWDAARRIVKRAEVVVNYAGQDLTEAQRYTFYEILSSISRRLEAISPDGTPAPVQNTENNKE